MTKEELELELNRIYTKCKIKYDPFNYSLKDRVILGRIASTNRVNHLDQNAEVSILVDILNKIKTEQGKENACTPTTMLHSSFDNVISSCLPSYNLNADIVLLQRDNLYISMDTLNSIFGQGTLKLTKPQDAHYTKYISEKIEPLIYFCVALKRPTSLIYNLIFVNSDVEKMSLKDLNDVKFVEDSLLRYSKDVENINNKLHIILSLTLQNIYDMPSSLSDLTKYNAESIEYAKNYTSYEFRNALKKILYNTVTFSLEILYTLNNLKDLNYKQKLIHLFGNEYYRYKSSKKNDMKNLLDYFCTITDNDELIFKECVSDIMTEQNPEKRFQKIMEFMDMNNSYLDIILTDFEANECNVNEIFRWFVFYVMNLGVQSVRVKIMVKLLKIAKELGISNFLNPEATDLINGFSEFITSQESVTSESLLSPKLQSTKSSKRKLNQNTISEMESKNVSFEEIDKVVSSFKENKYKFHIIRHSDTLYDESNQIRTTYNKIRDAVQLINKNLIKQIMEIRTYNEGGKNPGLKSGKLDRKNIYKYKYCKDIFYNNTYKIKESDLAFGIILDASGSMSGEKIKNGITTMIILHETLKALGINHCILAHNSEYDHECNIHIYQDFKENPNFQINKNYGLVNIEDDDCNCDSGVLYYMEKEFSRVRNKDKICLVFSDGQPTNCTDTELKDQIRNMEKKGIKVIGIGVKFDKIKEYYKDYANGRNLKEMLDITASILKQYVLDKKE